MKISAIVLGGGMSSRMGRDKLYITLGQETVFHRAVSAFVSHPLVDEVIAVVREGTDHSFDNATVKVVCGGVDRMESSVNGIKAASGDIVLIHDAARPYVSDQLITRVIECCRANRSAVPYVMLKDSIKKISDGRIVDSPNRAEYAAVQTPQAFYRAEILNAYEVFGDVTATDDSHVYSLMYGDPYLVDGEESNIKITTPIDVAASSRLGTGYDLHKLEAGRVFMLGGVQLDAPFGAVAHSDGDCLVHAIIDALFAGAGMRDIGYHYPDTDPRYKGIDSLTLLKDACARVRMQGYAVQSISAIVVLDKPKLAGYIPQMQSVIAEMVGIEKDAVILSAKTTERTAIDRVECFATATLNRSRQT